MAQSVEETVQTCPQCGTVVRCDRRFTTWCAACDWNVDPAAPDEEPGFLERRRRGAAQRYGSRLHAELMARGERATAVRRRGASAVAVALALVVHAVTVVVAACGIWLLATGWGHAWRLVGALFLLGAAWTLRPRLGRLPDDAPVLRRAAAPALFALVDEVAAVIGTRGVDAVVLDVELNASVTTYGLRGRRLLTLGVPLWEILGPQERVALLGHELGHFGNGDIRHGHLVGQALRSLTTWYYFLARTQNPTPMEALVNLVTLGPRLLIAGVLHLLHQVTLRATQRAEYLADAKAADAASAPAAVRLMDALLVTESAEGALRREANSRQVKGRGADADGLWERLAVHVRSVPEGEYERLRRVGARRGHSVDSTHPPTHLRRDVLTGHPPGDAAVRVDPVREAAVAAELGPGRARLARELLRDGRRG
ncbi:M48 family metalloprotease [Streptomyces sp. SID14478]|nr:M48 family metalloprotease [Streptomyces sp. SID14478]